MSYTDFLGGGVEVCLEGRLFGVGGDAVIRHDGDGGEDGDYYDDDEEFYEGEARSPSILISTSFC